MAGASNLPYTGNPGQTTNLPSKPGQPSQSKLLGGGNSNAGLQMQAGAATGTPYNPAGSNGVPVNTISQIPPNSQILDSARSGSGPATWNFPDIKNPNGTTSKGAGQVTNPKNFNRSVENWLQYFYKDIAADPGKLQKFSTEAATAGLVKPGATMEQLYAAWQKLLVQAYNFSLGNNPQSPWDVLANSIPGDKQGSFKGGNGKNYLDGLSAKDIGGLAGKASEKSKDQTVTTDKDITDIMYTDPDTARYVMNKAAQTLLGRRATNQEISQFTTSLNKNEREHPKRMTTHTEMTGDTTTDTSKNMGGTAGGANNTPAPTGAGGGAGQVVVGYDGAGNPIYGQNTQPTPTTSINEATAKNVKTTNTSVGEQDYTRYGREQLAEDQAMKAPDYGAYQAGAVYFQAFLNALRAPVPGVGSNAA